MIDKIYTVEMAANVLNSNEQTIRRLIKEGNLVAVKKLGKWYILHSNLIKFLKS